MPAINLLRIFPCQFAEATHVFRLHIFSQYVVVVLLRDNLYGHQSVSPITDVIPTIIQYRFISNDKAILFSLVNPEKWS